MDHFAESSKLEGFNFEKFHKQGQFCAAVSRVLGQILGYEELEDLFTVSILNNIGKLIIALYFKDEHKEINGLKELEGISSSDAERRVLGLGHAEIGALLLQRFNISQDICDAVRFHDEPHHIGSEESNFQLELISKESARIADNFVLPEEVEFSQIIDRLRGAIWEGQKMHREMLRTEMRSQGYQELFAELLSQASSLVYEDMKGNFQERSHQEGVETGPDFV